MLRDRRECKRIPQPYAIKPPNMSTDDKKQAGNPFLLNSVYPDPTGAFLHKPRTLEEIKGDCIVFLDTNVLLLPYSTGKNSLETIKSVYSKLVKDERIFIPQRVMQEFEKNVPEKLKEIYQAISRTQSISTSEIQFPLLEERPEYKELIASKNKLADQITAYRKNAKETLSVIEGWHHDDPVRSMYRDIFSGKNISTKSTKSEKDLLTEWERRAYNKLPPGYKDAGKEDSGIGDFLIWEAILETSADLEKDAIFVTGDVKADWWHVSENKALYARRELLEEFRGRTKGKTIRFLTTPKFLELYGANSIVVKEVEKEQFFQAFQTTLNLPHHRSRNGALAILDWLAGLIDLYNIDPEVVHDDGELRLTVRHEGKVSTFIARSMPDLSRVVAKSDSIGTFSRMFINTEESGVTFINAFNDESDAEFANSFLPSIYPDRVNIVNGYIDSAGNFIPVGKYSIRI
jgi:predicted nucleic acid-binding protein